MILLNNMTQPLAGLLVALFPARTQTGPLIVGLALAMGSIGLAVTLGSVLLRQRRAIASGD